MEIGEAVHVSNVTMEADKCVFCGEKEHDFPEKKKVDISKIKSKPKNLGCGDLSPKQEKGKYGRARHHMIPVHQCYTKLNRIVQMAESVSYDINGKQNGIPLPTCWNPYKVNGKNINFGKIEDEEIKNGIRNAAMRDTGAQWHVGNHHYDIPEKEDTTEDMEDEGDLDHQPYDEAVLWALLAIADKFGTPSICEEDKQEKIKDYLDKLYSDIKKKLNNFASNPSKSYPYYVSLYAMKFEG